jgi:6-phosphogluconolactonase/glucosamine-6-phosphate isomerase/deaminase
MPGIKAMLDPSWTLPVATSTAPDAPLERISLTLRGLREVREVFLLVRDAPAREAYAAAGKAHAATWPLAALLRHLDVPVQVLTVEP